MCTTLHNNRLPCWAITISPIVESSKLKTTFIERYLIDSKNFVLLVALKKGRLYFCSSGFFNPRPEQPSYLNPQQVAPHPPPTTDEEANTTEQDCDWNYICFDCSGDYEWYDLRGKGTYLPTYKLTWLLELYDTPPARDLPAQKFRKAVELFPTHSNCHQYCT